MHAVKVEPRWRGSFPGIPLAGLTVTPADPKLLALELGKVADAETRASLAPNAGHLAGVGLVATLPFFEFIGSTGAHDFRAWPTHSLRAYPLQVAAEILASPDNPLVELALRVAETRRHDEAVMLASSEAAARAREFQEQGLGWDRAPGFVRACLRAASPMPPGPMREALVALALATVEEQLTLSNAAPSFDTEINHVLRRIAGMVTDAQNRAADGRIGRVSSLTDDQQRRAHSANIHQGA